MPCLRGRACWLCWRARHPRSLTGSSIATTRGPTGSMTLTPTHPHPEDARAPHPLSSRPAGSTSGAVANQLDASCREEDQDGDTTVCESNRWWTRRFGEAQTIGRGPRASSRSGLSCQRRASSRGLMIASLRLSDTPTPRGESWGLRPGVVLSGRTPATGFVRRWRILRARGSGPTSPPTLLPVSFHGRGVPRLSKTSIIGSRASAVFGVQTSIDWQKRAYPVGALA